MLTSAINAELDMADPQSLSDFVGRNARAFPADRYALFLWDHGMSWAGYGVDEDPGPHVYMSHSQIVTGLTDGTQIAP